MTSTLALRKVARCSRNDLAEKSRIGRFKVWQLESGHFDPTPAEESALGEALLALVLERSIEFHSLLQQTA